VTGDWRKLRNEELHKLHSSPTNIIRVISQGGLDLAGPLSCMGQKRNAHSMLAGKTEGKPTHRWNVNIKMDLGEIGWHGMD
jgi:hypothetical protein